MITTGNVEQDLSSDVFPPPFIGKYHSLLRSRKKQVEKKPEPSKKEYRKKKIIYKNLFNIYQQWKLQMPLSQNHVYNFCNILAINQKSMTDPFSEESFISTKFYMKKVKKAMIHKDALLLVLEDMNETATPIPYICERLKSLGNQLFLQMAKTLEDLEQTLPEINKKLQTDSAVEQQNQVNEFVKEMSGKLYFSQFSPHMLILSRSLLELLGYNDEQFAVECIKYKSIIYEFFSAQHYAKVIYKHLQNMKLLKSYLEGQMSLAQFCQKSLIEYTDFVYNRVQKKIKCNFYAGTSKSLKPYIEVKETIEEREVIQNSRMQNKSRNQSIEQYCENHRHSQIQVLKKIMRLPEQLIPENKKKICTYKLIDDIEINQSQKIYSL